MSKIIKMKEENIEELVEEFREILTKNKIPDGRISFFKNLNNTEEKATLYFTEKAWIKMQSLITCFDKEVAWHGLAERGENDDYYVTDIMVYPQEVTGASVDTDQKEYEKWLMNFNDEDFNKIRFQGHSHVEMGTTPSDKDLKHQKAILDQLTDDMFYIFVIWNKKGEKNIKIYDMGKNTLYEGTDVKVEIIPEEDGLQSFIDEARELVKAKTFVPTISSIEHEVGESNGTKTSTKKKWKAKAGTKIDEHCTPYNRRWEEYYGYFD